VSVYVSLRDEGKCIMLARSPIHSLYLYAFVRLCMYVCCMLGMNFSVCEHLPTFSLFLLFHVYLCVYGDACVCVHV